MPAWTTAVGLPRSRSAEAVLRNVGWLGLDKAVSVAVGLVVFGLIARHFGAEGAGRFSYGVALLQATLGLALVCSSAAVMPRLVRLPDGVAARLLANVFVVRLAASVIAAAAVAGYAAAAIDDPLRRAVALAMLLAVPLVEPFAAFSVFWTSRNRNRRPVVARSAGHVVRLAVVAVAIWAGASAWIVALAWVAEAAVTAALHTGNLRGVRPAGVLAGAVRRARVGPYLRHGLRFVLGMWFAQVFLRLDRLWLAERMDPHAFGLYATAMQLVDVWLTVAVLLAGSMGPAFLYRAVWRSSRLGAHWRTLATLGGIGVAGLAVVALAGDALLTLVFGTPFAAAQGYLVAGFGAAVLFFIDQFVQVSITANNHPARLAAKWAAAGAVSIATLALAAPRIGAFAGPLAMALGLTAGWIVVACWRRNR